MGDDDERGSALPTVGATPAKVGPSSLQPIDVGNSSLILPDAKPEPSRLSFAAKEFRSRYGFRRVLGEGGMGEVNLVADKTIGREVAMKVIRGKEASAQAKAKARFVREARVQGQLEHPSVVPVYDLGADPDGNLYFTMKRIRGKSLQEIFKGLHAGDPAFQKQYSRRKLLTAFNNACLTMAFAHARGVLHRDLKPANIMLGDFGEVYVLDWGLAKIRGTEDLPPDETITDDSQVDPEQTIDGDVMGTPGYMAPEQLAGANSEVDERADVYALGCILFQILTGERMHSGRSLAAIVFSTTSPAEPPSERAPDLDIAPELDRLCAAAMALDPADRLTSAELCEALESYLEGDRDLALRRAAAETHAQKAARAFDREGFIDDEAARGEAMRDVTAALGMDPNNETGLATLVRLLTEAPKKVPAEAQEDIDRARLEAKRVSLRAACVVYLSFIALVPFVLYMGVKSWPAFAAEGVAISTCFLLSFYHLRDESPSIPFDHLIATTVTVVISTVMLGPFMLVPTLALANTAAYGIAANDRSIRVWIVVMGTLAVVVPVVLQLTGVLPSAFEVVDGQMVMQSLMFELTPMNTVVFLCALHVPVVIGCGWYIAKVKSAHTQLETEMRVQAWQLAQIVPKKLRRAAAV